MSADPTAPDTCPVDGCDYDDHASKDDPLRSLRSHVGASADHPDWGTVKEGLTPASTDETDDDTPSEGGESPDDSGDGDPDEGGPEGGPSDPSEGDTDGSEDDMATDEEYKSQHDGGESTDDDGDDDPDSVNYSGNSFDYTDDGTDNDLTVYYVAATQASLKLKKVAPGGSASETLVEHDVALINRRDPNRDPLEFRLNASALQAVVPTNWTLEWTIDGPYNAGWDDSTDPTPVNFLVSVPIRRATVSEIDGLAQAVRTDSSQRV
jgi:hypothetical protein